jgi:invasion protein IalB
MDHRIASARSFGRALTAMVAAVGIGAALVAAPAALAQTPKPAPKAPAKSAAPAPAPQQAQQQPPAAVEAPQLMYSPWMKVCGKGNDPNAPEVCTTAKDGRLENGMPVAVVQLVEPKGDSRKLLRVIVPLGMQLRPGTRLIIDQGQPATAPYSICFPVGCMADYEVNADTIAQMKKGQNIIIQAINMQGSAISLPLPLADFAKAYDGPPTDPKVFEEQQRKLQEELQKKAEEARKKLESQNQAPATQIPPTAPAPPTAQKK